MILVRRASSVCLAVVISLLALAAVPAVAQDELSVTERIFLDYAEDGVIDGHWDPSDLAAALNRAEGDRAYDGFSSAVQRTYDRDILGLSAGSGPSGDDGSSFLPQPTGPGERDQPPWPFLALSALAAALVVTGAGTSILRRVRR